MTEQVVTVTLFSLLPEYQWSGYEPETSAAQSENIAGLSGSIIRTMIFLVNLAHVI